MPLLCEDLTDPPFNFYTSQPEKPLAEHVSPCAPPDRKQSQHSVFAKAAILKQFAAAPSEVTHDPKGPQGDKENMASLKAPPESTVKASQLTPKHGNGVGTALTDTPATTAPNSPRMLVTPNPFQLLCAPFPVFFIYVLCSTRVHSILLSVASLDCFPRDLSSHLI